MIRWLRARVADAVYWLADHIAPEPGAVSVLTPQIPYTEIKVLGVEVAHLGAPVPQPPAPEPDVLSVRRQLAHALHGDDLQDDRDPMVFSVWALIAVVRDWQSYASHGGDPKAMKKQSTAAGVLGVASARGRAVLDE